MAPTRLMPDVSGPLELLCGTCETVWRAPSGTLEAAWIACPRCRDEWPRESWIQPDPKGMPRFWSAESLAPQGEGGCSVCGCREFLPCRAGCDGSLEGGRCSACR